MRENRSVYRNNENILTKAPPWWVRWKVSLQMCTGVSQNEKCLLTRFSLQWNGAHCFSFRFLLQRVKHYGFDLNGFNIIMVSVSMVPMLTAILHSHSPKVQNMMVKISTITIFLRCRTSDGKKISYTLSWTPRKRILFRSSISPSAVPKRAVR